MSQLTWIDGRQTDVGTVFCFARNHYAHAKEMGASTPSEPLLFLKSAHAVRPLGAGGVAFPTETFHHEAELVVVIDDVVPMDSDPGWSAVGGVALGLDLTRRSLQSRLKAGGLPWTMSKSFQGSAPVSHVVPMEFVERPDELCFELSVEGKLRQRGDVARMTFSVPKLLAWLSEFTPRAPGDVIFTGSPSGVADINVCDRFTLRFVGTEWVFEGRL